MKKTLSLLLTLFLVCTALIGLGEAAPAAPQVYVSITDDTGALVLAMEPVTAADHDGDGAFTIHDALTAAHAAHPDGAEAYTVAQTQWGLSLMELWGVENGGSYGYYLNDAMATGLLAPVAEGDHIKAYAYTDLEGFSDTYSWFEAPTAEVKAGETLPLTLYALTFDENFAPVSLPAADARLTANGEATHAVTDAEGKAGLVFHAPGTYLVSAVSDTMVLVAPVCLVTVTE